MYIALSISLNELRSDLIGAVEGEIYKRNIASPSQFLGILIVLCQACCLLLARSVSLSSCKSKKFEVSIILAGKWLN